MDAAVFVLRAHAKRVPQDAHRRPTLCRFGHGVSWLALLDIAIEARSNHARHDDTRKAQKRAYGPLTGLYGHVSLGRFESCSGRYADIDIRQ